MYEYRVRAKNCETHTVAQTYEIHENDIGITFHYKSHSHRSTLFSSFILLSTMHICTFIILVLLLLYYEIKSTYRVQFLFIFKIFLKI